MSDIWDSIEYRVFPKRHLCAAEVSAVSAVSSGTDMDTADTWQRLGRAARTSLTTHAASPHIQLAGGAGHEGEGGYGPVVVLLGDLLLATSQSVAAAAEMSGMEASSFILRKQFGNDGQ